MRSMMQFWLETVNFWLMWWILKLTRILGKKYLEAEMFLSLGLSDDSSGDLFVWSSEIDLNCDIKSSNLVCLMVVWYSAVYAYVCARLYSQACERDVIHFTCVVEVFCCLEFTKITYKEWMPNGVVPTRYIRQTWCGTVEIRCKGSYMKEVFVCMASVDGARCYTRIQTYVCLPVARSAVRILDALRMWS